MSARDSGIKGESEAEGYLLKKGYSILQKNFRSRFGEIDIICQKNKLLVFVEVKTRSTNSFGYPIESVTKAKLSKIVATAHIFMSLNPKLPKDFRFDVVEVFGNGQISHTENITI